MDPSPLIPAALPSCPPGYSCSATTSVSLTPVDNTVWIVFILAIAAAVVLVAWASVLWERYHDAPR